MAKSRISRKLCKSKRKIYRKSHKRSGKHRKATCVKKSRKSRRRKSSRRKSSRRRRSSRSKKQGYSSPPKTFSFPALGYQEDTRLI